MYSAERRRQALDLIDSGASLRAVSMATGINRSTLREWRDNPEKVLAARAFCPRCADDPVLPEPHADYFCGAALDRLGVEWRFARPDVISFAKKDAVARLDKFVGPKY